MLQDLGIISRNTGLAVRPIMLFIVDKRVCFRHCRISHQFEL